MKTKVIILVGLPLSGKSSHATILTKKENIPLVETGTFVYKAVEERGLEATPENVRTVAGECKAISDAYFTEKALEFIESNHSDKPVAFLSGLKALSEVNLCREKFGKENVYTISFHASINTRHQRLRNQDRQEASAAQGQSKATEDIAMAEDINRFNTRDEKELSYGLGDLIALADYVINTEDRLWPYAAREHTLKEFWLIVNDIIKKN
jgi:dephospho-CoA kinase